MIKCLLLSIILFTANIASAALEESTIGVDDGGTLIVNQSRDPIGIAKVYTSLRQFLWRHWRDRVLGRITVKGATTEGQPYSFNYSTGKNGAGVWRVVVETESVEFDSIAERSEHKSDRYEAYNVLRVEVSSTGKTVRSIPKNEHRAAESYRLVLKDREGKMVMEPL